METTETTEKLEENKKIVAGEFIFTIDYPIVVKSGREIFLTKTEMKLLSFLVVNSNRVLTVDQILDKVWGYNNSVDTRVVAVYMGYLRKKLGVYIESVHGFGYRLLLPVEKNKDFTTSG